MSGVEILGCVSLRKSRIGFLNPKESENGFCVSLLNRSIQDLWDHGASKEPKNPLDSSVPLKHRDPKDLGLICLVKKPKIHFQILSDLRIQSWIFLKKCTLSRKNQDVSFTPIAFMTPIALLMIPGKLDCWSRKRKPTNQPIINPGIKHYDWFILPLLLLSDNVVFFRS